MYSAVGETPLLDQVGRERQKAMALEGVQCAAKHAQAASVRLAVEPLNRFETDLLNTVEQAMSFLQDSNCESVRLLLDTFHMTVAERDIPNARRRAGDRVFHFHACANDRGTPGNDHLPWRMIVTLCAILAIRDRWRSRRSHRQFVKLPALFRFGDHLPRAKMRSRRTGSHSSKCCLSAT
jgi:hypothetical protein